MIFFTVIVSISFLGDLAALAQGEPPPSNSREQERAPHPRVKVIENGDSKRKPEDCRGIIVGVGVNQPDHFPGYGGFVGWESPIRLKNGVWLVGFNAGYWHASAGYGKAMGLPDGSLFITSIATGSHRTEDAKNNGIRCIRLRVRADHSGIDLLPAPNR
ncbi:hypothetical protein SAMN05444166_3136 [Singulisphaera sp. GP187]|uniref:hypothetical protein n=1 Tax=Singulisphaera sp. GP187 TaxID=1882752 RepID=UPI000929C961|nr:hypothetical protein [Singulisphaera sp. GP187]SIO23307.1 hypothetical protein SAMN05444166_3136 [Singulisphaera sp. GP187]